MNTPNKITLSRLLLIPLIVFFYLANFIPFGKLVGTILFVVACLTDFLDGYLARKNNQVTLLGKFFDSIADKVLIMTGLLLIVFAGGETFPAVYPTWLGLICVIIILAREFIVSALRQIAAAKGVVLAADMGGKIKATVQYIAVTLYMVFAFIQQQFLPNMDYSNAPQWVAIVRFVLMAALVAATLLTIYSGASYLIRNRHVFKETTSNKEAVKVETFAKTEKPDPIVTVKTIEQNVEGKIDCDGMDDLFCDAVRFIIENQSPSSTALQRKFSIGYPRAALMIDYMEAFGIVSAVGEDGKRKVLITQEEFDKRI